MRLLRTVALLVAISLALLPALGAAQSLQSWRRDVAWSMGSRELDFNADPRGFVFESRRLDALDDDVLVGRFHLRDAEFRLDLRNETGEGGVRTMTAALEQVLEFRDANQDGRYDATDPVVRRWRLADALVPALEVTPARDGSRTVLATYPLGAPLDEEGATDNPTVELRFHLNSTPRTIGGTSVAPTEIKFDIELYDIHYNTTDSQLAVEFRVEDDVATATEASAVGSRTGEFRFSFGWKPDAAVDGVTEPVLATVVPTSERTSNVYLAYERGARILHDPSVGVQHYEATMLQPIAQMFTKGSSLLYVVGLLAAAAVVAVATIVRARRQ